MCAALTAVAPALQRCDIDEVHDISPEEFLLRYVLPRRPVMIRGGAARHPIREQFTRAELVRRCVLLARARRVPPWRRAQRLMTMAKVWQLVVASCEHPVREELRAQWHAGGDTPPGRLRRGNVRAAVVRWRRGRPVRVWTADCGRGVVEISGLGRRERA